MKKLLSIILLTGLGTAQINLQAFANAIQQAAAQIPYVTLINKNQYGSAVPVKLQGKDIPALQFNETRKLPLLPGLPNTLQYQIFRETDTWLGTGEMRWESSNIKSGDVYTIQ